MQIKFAPKSHQRLEEIADYIYQKTDSKTSTCAYIHTMEKQIELSLGTFPKLGCLVDEFGTGIRKSIHQRYAILYTVCQEHILVLTIYRENLPKL